MPSLYSHSNFTFTCSDKFVQYPGSNLYYVNCVGFCRPFGPTIACNSSRFWPFSLLVVAGCFEPFLFPPMSSSASNAGTWRGEGNNTFCLGMEDLCRCHEKDASDVENVAPKVKKLKLSLKKPRPGSRLKRVQGCLQLRLQQAFIIGRAE